MAKYTGKSCVCFGFYAKFEFVLQEDSEGEDFDPVDGENEDDEGWYLLLPPSPNVSQQLCPLSSSLNVAYYPILVQCFVMIITKVISVIIIMEGWNANLLYPFCHWLEVFKSLTFLEWF